MSDPIQTVPLAAFEAQGERNTRIIAHMAIGWCISVIVLAIVLLFAISVDYETVEEVVTTETSTDVAQHADNNGSNYFAGGDMSNGDTDSEADGQDDQNNEDNIN